MDPKRIVKIPSMGQKMSVADAMILAIQEAKKGIGYVSPNPPVGCVILDRESQFLSCGYHAKFGEGHAERIAVDLVSDKSRLVGAQLIVTLEPCAHVGKTPSCAKFLATLPLDSIEFGKQDPFSQVNGQGISMLQKAGIKTRHCSMFSKEIDALMEVYLFNQSCMRSFVALKTATTLDGYMATNSGESQWITNDSARSWVQELRGHYDAIMIGRKTLELDNPALNIRKGRFKGKKIKVVVIDPEARSLNGLKEKKLLEVHSAAEIFYLVKENLIINKEEMNLPWENIIFLPMTNKGELDLKQAGSRLFSKGIASVLVEGGSDTFSRFLNQQAAEKLYLFMSPSLLGGRHGLPWTKGLEVAKLDQRIKIDRSSLECFNDDFLISGRISYAE